VSGLISLPTIENTNRSYLSVGRNSLFFVLRIGFLSIHVPLIRAYVALLFLPLPAQIVIDFLEFPPLEVVSSLPV